jgi:hypothetical protein
LVLNFLLDRLLVKRGFHVQAPVYSAGDYREEEVAADDGDADVIDDIKDEVLHNIAIHHIRIHTHPHESKGSGAINNRLLSRSSGSSSYWCCSFR